MSNNFKIEEIHYLSQDIQNFFDLQSYEPDIVKWCVENINLSDDVSAEKKTLDFSKYRYQLEPLKACAELRKEKNSNLCIS